MSDTSNAVFASAIYADLLKLQKSTIRVDRQFSLSLFLSQSGFHFTDVPAGGIYFDDAATLSTDDAGAFDDAKLNSRCSQRRAPSKIGGARLPEEGRDKNQRRF